MTELRIVESSLSRICKSYSLPGLPPIPSVLLENVVGQLFGVDAKKRLLMVCEVEVDAAGLVKNVSEPVSLIGDGVDDLGALLTEVLEAFKKPVVSLKG